MRKPFKIGNKEYKFKKDAIVHYRGILNFYDSGETLNNSDYDDIIDLLNYDYFNHLVDTEVSEENVIDNEGQEDDLTIDLVKIAKVQFNTKWVVQHTFCKLGMILFK